MTDPWRRRVELAEGRATLYEGDALRVLPVIGPVDHIITDPPYSERTHSGHDSSSRRDASTVSRESQLSRPLGYKFWTDKDADAFADVACRASSGWIVWMCDHGFARTIECSLQSRDRYVFAPLPYVAEGSSIRLAGDGPSSWTVWVIVSRTAAQHRWGTLPGAYVRRSGWDKPKKMGGKPVALMDRIVSDYSRPGDLVCDPCMGRASTALACLNTGRRFVGIECDSAEFDAACERIDHASRQGRLFA